MQDKEKIIEAVKIIKEICAETERCEECPFHGEGYECGTQDSPPKDWMIEPVQLLRVFKQ